MKKNFSHLSVQKIINQVIKTVTIVDPYRISFIFVSLDKKNRIAKVEIRVYLNNFFETIRFSFFYDEKSDFNFIKNKFDEKINIAMFGDYLDTKFNNNNFKNLSEILICKNK